MAIDTEDIVIFGSLAYLYYYYETRGAFNPSASLVPGYPGSSPYALPGTSVYGPNMPTGTAVVTSPLVIPAQSQINQQIQNQNLDISAAAAIGTAVVSSLATSGVLAASVAGPIGAAIAAVALLIKQLLSDTHLYANQLVQRYENPYGNGVISLVQAITDELNAGTLNLADASAARDALVSSWQNYQSAMHQIQTQGTDWYIVATQSLNNLDNQYLGTVLPNGKTLGAGMGGAYGNTINHGFMSSWIDWINTLVSSYGG